MRHSIITLPVAVALGAIALLPAGGVAGAARTSNSGGSSEVLSIENAQGTYQVRGRGYLNMRVTQGAVLVVDLTPTDRFSPYLGGVPRGRSSGTSGRDINLYVLGGRYRVLVRGSGINISARGDGLVQMLGEADSTGNVGTIRIGDLVSPIEVGEGRASFGGTGGGDGGPGPSKGRSSGGDGVHS